MPDGSKSRAGIQERTPNGHKARFCVDSRFRGNDKSQDFRPIPSRSNLRGPLRMNDPFAELGVTTNFSFLRGAAHPQEFVAAAISLGLSAIGIADRNSVAGVVRAYSFLRDNHDDQGTIPAGFRALSGARLVFTDSTPDIIAYPRDRLAWGRLCRLLTAGNRRAPKGECHLTLADLVEWAEGLSLIVMDGGGEAAQRRATDALRPVAESYLWIGVCPTYGRSMRADMAKRLAFAQAIGLPPLATNDALMDVAAKRELLDVLTCIREGVTIDQAGRRLAQNAERHIKSPREMTRLFAQAPQAIAETQRFADGITFSLKELGQDYPQELRAGYATEQDALEDFTSKGAKWRYPDGVPERIEKIIRHELALIAELDYAAFFLTVYDIVRYARDNGILAQGRGSAANSVVCFCLGITDVQPDLIDVLFERFVSKERNEPPDIDVDFEHERREEVIQHIYNKYGRDRAALTATVISYRSRSSIREVGKALGFSEDVLGALSGSVWSGYAEFNAKDVPRLGLDPHEPRLAKAIELAEAIRSFPRHLSQHTGGFVITQSRLDELVPISNATMENRTVVEWDKDDLDALGILKVDILALGMLTCLAKGFALLDRHYGRRDTIASVTADQETEVYEMISNADTIGVFQIESRAQMSMLPRLRPKKFYDLVIEVAIVRPGPIQGDMVHPYLRRRLRLEEVNYITEDLRPVLERTLGVPLFQEQAMKIAIVAGGFSPGRADQLRRAMATFKKVGTIGTFRDEMIEGMVAKKYPREFAERVFKQIEGFGTYGFPESHAASFAALVYVSSWMKCHYPDVFCAAILNSQPMGFYAPSQLVRDAREHGVEVRPVDINASDWDCTLEPENDSSPSFETLAAQAPQDEVVETDSLILRTAKRVSKDDEPHRSRIHHNHAWMADHIRTTHAVRLGFRQVRGLNETDMKKLVSLRAKGYDSVRDVWLRTGLAPAVLERLAEADAFASLGLSRRDAVWAVRGLNRAGDKDDLPLLAPLAFEALEPDAGLPSLLPGEEVIEDYRYLSLSLKAHPVSFLRAALARKGILRNGELATMTRSHEGGAVGETPETPTPALRADPPRMEEGEIPRTGSHTRRVLSRVTVSGLVLVRQRPGSASGVVFMTLEDETGVANIIVWPKIFERLRPIVIGARFLSVTGRLQSESGVTHVVAERMEDLTPMMGLLSRYGAEVESVARADEVRHPQHPRTKQEVVTTRRALPKGRNFQ